MGKSLLSRDFWKDAHKLKRESARGDNGSDNYWTNILIPIKTWFAMFRTLFRTPQFSIVGVNI